MNVGSLMLFTVPFTYYLLLRRSVAASIALPYVFNSFDPVDMDLVNLSLETHALLL